MIINNIIIVGGGSSGWLTAAYLSNNLPPNIKITLIESSKIPTIGVGEGTQPFTMPFLKECGLEPTDWMKKTDATYKYGVELIGWGNDPVFIDNDTQEMAVLGPNIMFHNYWLSKKHGAKEYFNSMPAYILAKHNKAPKANHPDLDYTPGYTEQSWDAVHFNAHDIISTLKAHCKDRITYIDDLIVEVITDEQGVTGLKTKNNGILTADLYIDCSGFDSLLLEKSLGVKFIPADDVLLCNRAVAIPKQYTNKKEEMHPYTKAIAMDAGWRWTIPTYSRIGNGYVYCDNFISPEKAEEALRKSINEWSAPANHIKMKTGIHEHIAYKNVYAIGLSAAFAEPLEATGITFTTKAISNFVQVLNNSNGQWNDDIRNFLTNKYQVMVKEIINFLFLHYKLAPKDDTPFWKATKDIPYSSGRLPGVGVKNVLDKFVPNPPNILMEHGYFEMFHVGQWFSLLYGYDVYNKYVYNIDKRIVNYGDWVNTMYKDRTKYALNFFPNQYEYLKELYE